MEIYWGKVFRIYHPIFRFAAEIYENEKLNDTISVTKQIARKKFFSSYGGKKWIEKRITNLYGNIFVRESDVIRRSWDG